MKYLEELKYGDCFEYQNNLFILTNDFNNRNQLKCVQLNNGQIRWLDKELIVNNIQIYTLDHENNISPIKVEVNNSSY